MSRRGIAKYDAQMPISEIIYSQPWKSLQLPQCHRAGQSAVLKILPKKSASCFPAEAFTIGLTGAHTGPHNLAVWVRLSIIIKTGKFAINIINNPVLKNLSKQFN